MRYEHTNGKKKKQEDKSKPFRSIHVAWVNGIYAREKTKKISNYKKLSIQQYKSNHFLHNRNNTKMLN